MRFCEKTCIETDFKSLANSPFPNRVHPHGSVSKTVVRIYKNGGEDWWIIDLRSILFVRLYLANSGNDESHKSQNEFSLILQLRNRHVTHV